MTDGVASDEARLVIDELRREDGPMPLCVHLGATNNYDEGPVAIVKPTFVNGHITHHVGYQEGHNRREATYFVRMALDAILRIAVVQAKSTGRCGVEVGLYRNDTRSGKEGPKWEKENRLTGTFVYFTSCGTMPGSCGATVDSCLDTLSLFVSACVPMTDPGESLK